MTGLPDIIWRTPRLFYAVAVLAFGTSLMLGFAEMGAQIGYADTSAPTMQSIIWTARGRVIYGALYDATLFAAVGIVCQILLAIFRVLGAEGSRSE